MKFSIPLFLSAFFLVGGFSFDELMADLLIGDFNGAGLLSGLSIDWAALSSAVKGATEEEKKKQLQSQPPPDERDDPVAPVILMSGLTGSKIMGVIDRPERVPHSFCAKKSYEDLWFETTTLLPWKTSCWVENTSFLVGDDGEITNTDTGLVSGAIGYDLAMYDLAMSMRDGIQGAFLWGEFTQMQELLQRYNYKLGRDVQPWFYDWRRGPREWKQDDTFGKFQRLCESFYPRKVVIHSVSQGSTFMMEFLATMGQEWKDTYLEHWYSVSGVFRGTSEVTRFTAWPSEYDVYGILKWPLSMWINAKMLRDVGASFPGMHVMHPTYMDEDEPVVTVKDEHYTQKDIPELLKKFGHDDSIVNMMDKQELWYDDIPVPGVNMTCVWAEGLDTIKTAIYDDYSQAPVGNTTESGDEVVPKRSLAACEEWKDKLNFFNSTAYQNLTHTGVIGDDWPKFVAWLENLNDKIKSYDHQKHHEYNVKNDMQSVPNDHVVDETNSKMQNEEDDSSYPSHHDIDAEKDGYKKDFVGGAIADHEQRAEDHHLVIEEKLKTNDQDMIVVA